MYLTMMDPTTSWFEMIELPLGSVKYSRKGKEITEVVIDKTSAQISKLFNKQWLSRYPHAKYVIYDNGSEFKPHFQSLCESYGIKQKPTTVKNPQLNAILERIHAVIGDMLRTINMDMANTTSPEQVNEFVTNSAWAI